MLKNRILNIDILSISLSDLLDSLDHGVLFTPNVDHLVNLQKNKTFYESYQKADWIICDSKILRLGGAFLNRSFKEVIQGSSLFPAFINHHRSNREIKVFFLGSAEGVARQAMENVNKKVGWDIVIGAHSPSFTFENDELECEKIVDIINKSGANVLIVGASAPKQENWIIKYRDKLQNIKIFMALGATIDFEAGIKKRAPMFYQKMYLEWYYRLMQEPKRLWKRYLVRDISFFWYILKQRLGFYKNPFS